MSKWGLHDDGHSVHIADPAGGITLWHLNTGTHVLLNGAQNPNVEESHGVFNMHWETWVDVAHAIIEEDMRRRTGD